MSEKVVASNWRARMSCRTSETKLICGAKFWDDLRYRQIKAGSRVPRDFGEVEKIVQRLENRTSSSSQTYGGYDTASKTILDL